MFLSRYFMFIHTNVYVRPSYHLHSTTQRLTSRTGVKEENGFRYSAEFSETSASWSSFSVALVDGLGPTFRVYCLCMTWVLVHPLTWFNLLHIIDVLIFSVRFSVVGGRSNFSFVHMFRALQPTAIPLEYGMSIVLFRTERICTWANPAWPKVKLANSLHSLAIPKIQPMQFYSW